MVRHTRATGDISFKNIGEIILIPQVYVEGEFYETIDRRPCHCPFMDATVQWNR